MLYIHIYKAAMQYTILKTEYIRLLRRQLPSVFDTTGWVTGRYPDCEKLAPVHISQRSKV